jgi:hypothetical protein
MKVFVAQSKQSTLDRPTKAIIQTYAAPKKAILISNLETTTKEDELTLKVEFALQPSKQSYSKINLDLYFQEQLVNSTKLRLPESTLLNDNFDYSLILDMHGIGAGEYSLKVEMYEPWGAEEKLSFTNKRTNIQYIPQTRALRLVKIPTVKSVAGSGLTLLSSDAKDIYREIEQDLRKESIAKRDEW